MTDILRQYYRISEILNDDEYLVSYIVQKYHPKRLYFSAVLSDVQNASVDRLAKYSDTLDLINSMGDKQIRAEASAMTFDSEEAYTKYLKDLLEVNGVVFVSYSTMKMKSKKAVKPARKFYQGELF